MAEGGALAKRVTFKRQPHTRDTPLTETKCVTMTGTGGCGVIKMESKPVPIAKEGEVLIAVEACGIGFNDVLIRQGFLDNLPKFPFTMGSECSGVVIGLGTAESSFKIGDHVIAVPEVGAWAEVITVPEKYVFKIPETLLMPFPECSALFVNYVSAYIMLFGIANLQPGDSVLIHSAAGGLGMALIGLCRTVDNVTIFGTASKDKHIILNGLVNHLFDSQADYVAAIKEIAPEGVDLVLESRGGDDFYKALDLLRPLGKCIVYGSSNVVTGDTKSTFSFLRSDEKVIIKDLCKPNRAVAGFSLRQMLYRQNDLAKIRTAYEKVCRIVEERNIAPPIDTSFALEDTDLAMRRIQNRLNMGRIVLSSFVEPIRRDSRQKPSVTKTSSAESVIDPEPRDSEADTESNQPTSDAAAPVDVQSPESSSEPVVRPASTVKEFEHSVAVNKPAESQPSEQPTNVNDQAKPETNHEQLHAEPAGHTAENGQPQPNPEDKLKDKEGSDSLHDIPEEQVSEECAYEESHE